MAKANRKKSLRKDPPKGKHKKGAKAAAKLLRAGFKEAPDLGPSADEEAVELTTVDFWFDPRCPWAWLTSRWMLEVEKVRPVKTVFHVMSLAVLNAGRDHSGEYQRGLDQSWPAVRVALAVEQQYGQEQLAAYYTALGTRLHHRKEPSERATIEATLTDIGLAPWLADAGDTGDNDDALRTSHAAGMDPVGNDVGTPVIHVNGAAIFGPVVSPVPMGEEAGRVFDSVLQLTTTPGFFELKRGRSVGPIVDGIDD